MTGVEPLLYLSTALVHVVSLSVLYLGISRLGHVLAPPGHPRAPNLGDTNEPGPGDRATSAAASPADQWTLRFQKDSRVQMGIGAIVGTSSGASN
jgi:hypothetical protein